MAKSGNKGSIIVNSSTAASRATALPVAKGFGVYAASKAGANMLMKYAAIEVRACSSRAAFYLTLPTLSSPESIRGLFSNVGKRGADHEPCPFHRAPCNRRRRGIWGERGAGGIWNSIFSLAHLIPSQMPRIDQDNASWLTTGGPCGVTRIMCMSKKEVPVTSSERMKYIAPVPASTDS